VSKTERMSDKKKVVYDGELGLAYAPEHGVMVALHSEPAKKPTEPVETILQTGEWAHWGDDNMFPQYVIAQVMDSAYMPAVLNFKSLYLGSAGIFPGVVTGYDKGNNPIVQRVEHADIETFWQKNNMRLFLDGVLRNMYWFHHAFVELGMNDLKTYISSIAVHDTSHVRYSIQNKDTGRKELVFIDANWDKGGNVSLRKKQACIYPHYDVIGQLSSLPGKEICYPLFFESPGRTYYQQTPFHSIFNTKWPELAKKIPVFKSKLMDNQMNVKYLIHVPGDWWKSRYKKWDTMTELEQEQARKTTMNDFNASLTGVENTGKTLLMTFKSDSYGKNAFTKWEVQEMKGNLGDGAYIEDSQEALANIAAAMQFDNSLMGSIPGKGLQAGSGSDKRLADELFFKTNKPYSLTACEVLDVVSVINRWKVGGKQIKWFPGEVISTTLNMVGPGNR
jgi:hypothetical protein